MKYLSSSKSVAVLGVLALGIIGAGLWKGPQIVNFAGYLLFDGPYLSRTLTSKVMILTPGRSEWDAIISDKSTDTRIWHPIEIDHKLNSRLTVSYTVDEFSNLENFIRGFNKILSVNVAKSKQPSHNTVVQIVDLVHRAYRNAQSQEKLPDYSVFGRGPYRAENHIFQLVNRKCACGTVAEATISLLRKIGLKTRLMGMANDPQTIQFNHVFREYFSPEFEKWVMLDPMINAIPEANGIPLSSFEMINRPATRARLNELWNKDGSYDDWNTNGVYTDKKTVFFSSSGPFLTRYLHSPNPRIREKLLANKDIYF